MNSTYCKTLSCVLAISEPAPDNTWSFVLVTSLGACGSCGLSLRSNEVWPGTAPGISGVVCDRSEMVTVHLTDCE